MATTALERLRTIAATGSSLAPVHSALGTVIDHVEPGHVRAHVPVLPPDVLRGVGPVPVLADLVLSGAVTTTLNVECHITTLTLHISTLGRLPPAGTALRADGRLAGADADSAVSTAEISDADGRLVAVSTSRCAVLTESRGATGRATFERRPVPEPFAALDPVVDLVGGPDGKAVEMRVTAAGSLANSGGAVQGGVLAAAAAHALEMVLEAANPRLAGALCDLDVTFLRGVAADGSAFTVRADVVRAGARFGSARAEVRDAAGRLAVAATAAQWRG